MREVLPKWGVEWQTKDAVRDEISAPAAHIGSLLICEAGTGRCYAAFLSPQATILGWANGWPAFAAVYLLGENHAPCAFAQGFFSLRSLYKRRSII